jgi:hypothetical protein
MPSRQNAVLVALAGLLVGAGAAMGDNPVLTLDPATEPSMLMPTKADADTAPPDGLLMQGLGKIGADKTLADYGFNVYGWVESGYTYNHRHNSNTQPLLPGPFNHEFGNGDRNHYMLNQVDLRFERLVRSDKWDVGGLVEVLYGSDSAAIHSNGLGVGNEISGQHGGERESSPDDRYNPEYQFDPTQFYIDVNVPVGNGLKLRAGKFVTLLGNETIDPRGNPFYSHSWAFNAIAFTHTGVLGMYNVTDQLSVTAGVTRGWDQSFEDNNGCAIDFIGQVSYKINSQWTALLTWSVGPEDDHDNSHYRTAINPIVKWQATEKLSFTLEGLYVYDGGLNQTSESTTHAYGDVWGAVGYGSYVINDFVTANVRLEKFHSYSNTLGSASGAASTLGLANVPTINVYDVTLGVTIHPFPKDPIGKNLMIRPETRYSWSEDPIFVTGSRSFQDQWTFGADVIFTF